jgi:hypothetical protein
MKKSILLAVAGFGLASILLSGCTSTSEAMVNKGYGPNYSKGYGDGCTSGKNAGGSLFDSFTKDVRRYQADKKYAMGWKDGYDTCKSRWKETAEEIRASSK